MAYVGLRKPIIAKLLESGKYDKPFACGKAIGLQVNPNYAEGSLNADDKQAEYDKEFTYAEVTLNTSTLPIEAHEKMFGHTVDTAKKNVKFNVDDQANYVGMAWVSVEKVDGVRSFIGNFLKKAKFTEPSEDYSTKGDSIEYKTPSISGRALGLEDGSWKETEACSSEADALNGFVPELDEYGEEVRNEAGLLVGHSKMPDIKIINEAAVWFIQEGLAIKREENKEEIPEISDRTLIRQIDFNPRELSTILHQEFSRCFERKNATTTQGKAESQNR